MFVKICGITRLEDAEAAVACGAHAIGFVFWPASPRAIQLERAQAIVRALPPLVTPVGVFVNQPAEYVDRVADLVGLRAVQLHGDENADYAAALSRPVLKALTLDMAGGPDAALWPPSTLVLLDAHDPVRRGGTGQTIDWQAAAAVAASRRIVLAGGLTPDNVSTAISAVRPFGIDVSSGVEQSPGIKDRGRLRSLFEAIR
jgi:phosphoribosylanthranilate isomerase